MCNKIKGFDEDGMIARFQRVGGWCEPTAFDQKPITSEPEDRKNIQVDFSRDYCVKV